MHGSGHNLQRLGDTPGNESTGLDMGNRILTKWLICRADIHDGAYMPWFAIPPGTVIPEDPNEEQPIGVSFRTQVDAMQWIHTELSQRFLRLLAAYLSKAKRR